MKFLMITEWDNHWDKLHQFNHSTLFRDYQIHWKHYNSLPKENVETIFLRKQYNGAITAAWSGHVCDFRQDHYNNVPAIRFNVLNLKEIPVPQEYQNFKVGWHLITQQLQETEGEKYLYLSQQQSFTPPLFDFLLKTDDWKKFEKYSYVLLKMLGIHDICPIPLNDNRGKSDGFFLFKKKLAVIYDATLETDLSKKQTQIENYIAQLQQDKLVQGKRSYTIRGIDRQVWIIVRDGKKVELLQETDEIPVKIIPIKRLIKVYEKRLRSEMNGDEFWDLLKDLDGY